MKVVDAVGLLYDRSRTFELKCPFDPQSIQNDPERFKTLRLAMNKVTLVTKDEFTKRFITSCAIAKAYLNNKRAELVGSIEYFVLPRHREEAMGLFRDTEKILDALLKQ